MAKDPADAGPPFRLEDEPPREHVKVPPPAPRPPAAPPSGRMRREPPEPRYDAEGNLVVSETTVAERHDPSVRERSRPGALPDPPGWPLEALTFPFRGRGPLGLLAMALAFALADWLTVLNAFLGALAKVFLYVGLLGWQLRTVAGTATGDDRPPRPFATADFEPEALGRLFGVLLRLALYLLPAAFLFVRPYLATPDAPVHSAPEWIGIVGLAALGFLLAPVLLLGAALRWPGIAWPWHAVSWLARGLVPCVATGLGWAGCVVLERVVPAFGLRSAAGALAAYGALRLAVVGFAIVGARGLGVLARRFELAGGGDRG